MANQPTNPIPSGMEQVLYLYTSQLEVEVLMSQLGAAAFSDDNKDGIAELNVWVTMALYATRQVDLYCNRIYAAANLYQSYWVHEQATILCCYKVCKRRNNPVAESLEDDYNSAVQSLTDIRDSKMLIPNISPINTFVPAVNQPSVNDYFSDNKLRQITSISTANPNPLTPSDPAQLFQYPYGFYGL